MPLAFLAMAPGVELNLFYSLVPITGVALLLKALILGNYDAAFRFFLPVLLPMLVYAAVSLRWAIDQFQREDVLFREAERFSLVTWLRHLYRGDHRFELRAHDGGVMVELAVPWSEVG